MTIRPEIAAALGGAVNQLKLSLSLVGNSPLTETARFHFRELESVLCSDLDSKEEDEPL